MKNVVIFLLFNLIGTYCFAVELGVEGPPPVIPPVVEAGMQLPALPPQVEGMIKGNVIPNTNIQEQPRAEIVDEREPKKEVATEPAQPQQIAAVPEMKTITFGKMPIPADYKTIEILGKALVTREQALKYLQKTSAGRVRLSCSIDDIVNYYYEEAEREGVRPDLAFCQAILETGIFSFKGTVRPEQNNFCGLGSTDDGVHGAKFSTAREGVRAHIQHLLAYCRKEQPVTEIVDPRYDLAHRIRMSSGMVTNWYGLTGTWATDRNYCEKIMILYYAMVMMK